MFPVGKFPKFFGAVIAMVKAKTKFFRDDGIFTIDCYSNFALIMAEIFFRRETLHEQQPNGQQRKVVLRDIGQTVERRNQKDACDFVGICSRQIRGDTGAERLAHQINGLVGGEQLECFIGGTKQTLLTRRTRTIFIAGIFQNENVKRSDILNVIRVMFTANRRTAVAIRDHNHSFRRLPE